MNSINSNHLDLSLLRYFRINAPLVHCMTNDVVQWFTANVLLALGASPAMIIEDEEAVQFSTIANSLLINVGTLTTSRAKAMRMAIDSAVTIGIPWVLDPVAISTLLTFRTSFCHQILSLKPAVVRGNASEILALAGMGSGGKGVDATNDSINALSAAQILAHQLNDTIIAVTGQADYITDGQKTIMITGGTQLMTKVAGTGCALSAVVAASYSLPGNKLNNVASACRFMKYAGEIAVKKSAGPGSFSTAFIDALYQLGEKCEQMY